MPVQVQLLDTETGETIVRDGADALELLRQPDGRYKRGAPFQPVPLTTPREAATERPEGPAAVEAPYVPPSERAALPPDPALNVKGTKRPLTARGQARVNTKRALAAGAKAAKRKATLAAKVAAPETPQPEAQTS